MERRLKDSVNWHRSIPTLEEVSGGCGPSMDVVPVILLMIKNVVINFTGRAWLRSALNERTLENYLHSLLSNRPHLL